MASVLSAAQMLRLLIWTVTSVGQGRTRMSDASIIKMPESLGSPFIGIFPQVATLILLGRVLLSCPVRPRALHLD